MRYALGLAGLLISVSALADEPMSIAAVQQSSLIAVSLVVADPCNNTRHALDAVCVGKATFRTVESTQFMQALNFSSEGDTSVETPWQRYRVRTIDFY